MRMALWGQKRQKQSQTERTRETPPSRSSITRLLEEKGQLIVLIAGSCLCFTTRRRAYGTDEISDPAGSGPARSRNFRVKVRGQVY